MPITNTALGASAAEPETGPIVLRGTVAGVTDLAPDSVKVQITPDQQTVQNFDGPTSVFYSEVPAAMVETSGNSYTIRIDPAVIPPQDISATGVVNFNVYAEDPGRQTYSVTSASARAVVTRDGGYAWTDPVAPIQDLASSSPADRIPAAARALFSRASSAKARPTVSQFSRAPRAVRLTAAKPSIKGVICDSAGCATTDRAGSAQRVKLASAPARTYARALDDGETEDDTIDAPVIYDLPRATTCPAGGLGVVYGTKRVVDTTIGTAYPVGGDPAWMRAVSGSSKSLTASYGIAFAKGNGSGTFSQSGTKAVDRSVGFTWDGKTYARAFRVGLVYQKVQQMTGRCPGDTPDWTQEIPTAYSGGFGENTSGVTRPDWTNCRAMGSTGLWERKDAAGTSYSTSGGVKFASVIGIDLSVTRAYNDEAVLSYKIGVVGRRMCGNNDLPGTAGKVMERFKS